MDKIKKLIEKYREECLYFLFGFGTTFVSWTSYALMVAILHLPVTIGNALSWVFAVLFSFFVNKVYVFNSKSFSWDVLFPEFSIFMATRIATGIVEVFGVPILVGMGFDYPLFGARGMWAKISVCLFNVFINFALSKKVVFKDRTDSSNDTENNDSESEEK